MHFERKVGELCKDCSGGPDNEVFIFRETFFGNDKKDGGDGLFMSLDTASTTHEGKSCDGMGGSNSSNSEHSTLSSLSCKDLSGSSRHDDDVNTHTKSESSLADLLTPEKGQIVVGKSQTDPSIDVHPDTMSTANQILVSSLPSNSSCLIVLNPNETALPDDKFLGVESSNWGIVYNWSMRKECMQIKDGAHARKMGTLDCKFPGDGNVVGEAITSKAAASPVPQESFTTRLLVVGLPANVKETLGSPSYLEERAPECKEIVISVPENPLETCSIAECRKILHQHALNLLETSGWLIIKHKRPCRKIEDYKYQSPGGRSVRELCRAWRICGQMLIGGRSAMTLEEDTKEWDGFDMFFSDLKCILARVESEFNMSLSSNALAHKWIILDPFVTVFFIDKKIGALRKGEVVVVNRSCASGNNKNATLDWKDKFQNKDPFQGRNLCEKQKCGSKVLALCAERRNRGSSRRFNRGCCLTTNASLKLLTGMSSDMVDQQSDANKISPINAAPLPALGYHDTVVDLGINGLLGHSDEDEDIKCSIKGCNHSDKSLPLVLHDEDIKKKRQYEKGSGGTTNFKGRTKRSRKCHVGDDDLLVSVLMQNGEGSPFASTPKTKIPKLKVRRMLQARSDGWRLLPRSWGKANKFLMNKKWSLLGARTVLSWLISAGVISPNDVIQYRDLEDNSVIKDGLITWDGIICKCCSQVLSVSQFKIHSGFRSNHICLNLFMKESGPFSLCSLEAWSSEHKMRKNARVAVQVDENDCNDDLCAVCGDAGKLICCDNCPATYHQSCLLTKDLPEGNWYCPSCTCWICQELVDDRNPTTSSDAVKCLQCEHKYHKFCLKQRNGHRASVDGCFCVESCRQVHSVLRSHIGLLNHIADGYSWILLRCFHDDLKFPSAAKFVFKAECNSKLAVALSLMEECFKSMVDPRTGIDMIPHVLYNWGSDFARLNFDNFYTVVLENDDVLIAAASIRVHGVAVAEMPLIATCSKYRRQGMCRRLLTAIEQLLISIKVEKLVIAAVPQLVETWTNGFGFQILEDDERQSLNKTSLMIFPGTVLLKKTLYTKPAVPSGIICCGLEAEGLRAALPVKICCALKAEPTSANKAGTM